MNPNTKPSSPDSYALSPRVQVLIVIAIAILAGVGIMGFRSMEGRSGHKSADLSSLKLSGSFRPTPEQLASFKLYTVHVLKFQNEDVTDGTIANNDNTTTPVFSPYSGRVSKVIAKLGDHVQKGEPLMVVEATELVQGQNDLMSAVSALKTAQAQSTLSEANEKRQHELYLAKAGAYKDWLQSQTDIAAAQGNVRTAEITLDAVRNRLRILGMSDAEIHRLEMASSLRPIRSEAVLRAPISGAITQKQVGIGQYVQSGSSNPVFSIGNLSTVWLMANVRERDVSDIKVGQPVEVHVLAYPDRVFNARLDWIAPSVDPVTHRIPVRAEVNNENQILKPSMFANFQILTGSPVERPAVPQSAVVYEGSDAHVFVALPDGTIVLRQIQAGTIQNGMVEVISGIKVGERVVSSGTLFIDRAVEGASS